MAWLLLSSDPALTSAQHAPAVTPSFRCVSLGAWYQDGFEMELAQGRVDLFRPFKPALPSHST